MRTNKELDRAIRKLDRTRSKKVIAIVIAIFIVAVIVTVIAKEWKSFEGNAEATFFEETPKLLRPIEYRMDQTLRFSKDHKFLKSRTQTDNGPKMNANVSV